MKTLKRYGNYKQSQMRNNKRNSKIIVDAFEVLLGRQPSETDLVQLKKSNLRVILQSIIESNEFAIKYFNQQNDLSKLLNLVEKFAEYFPRIAYLGFQDQNEIIKRKQLLEKYQTFESIDGENQYFETILQLIIKSDKKKNRQTITTVTSAELNEFVNNFIDFMYLKGFYRMCLMEETNGNKFYEISHLEFSYLQEHYAFADLSFKHKYQILILE